MAHRPAVRARSAQDWLAYLDTIEPGLRQRVVARIPEPSRSIVVDAPRTEWLDLQHDRYVPWASIEEMGEAAAIDGWQNFLASHLESPLFKALADSMVRLFGFTPSTFVKLLPRGWKQAYRDCCEVKVMEASDHRAHAALVDVHPDILGWPTYITSWRGVLAGTFNIVGVDGQFEMEVDEQRRRIDAVWTW